MNLRRTIFTVGVVLGTLGAAWPAAAALRAPVPFTGYAWSTSPAPVSVDSFYALNTAGGGVGISHNGTGQYTVTFTGLSGVLFKPTVSVTTYDALTSCQAPVLFSSASQLEIGVLCYSFNGTPTDARFDLLVGQAGSSPPGVVDYAQVNGPSHLIFSYNSSHRRNSVRHLRKGQYQLVLRGPATTGVTGTVKVTAGTPDSSCEVTGWHGARAGEVVGVDCFSANGSRHDEDFFVAYARHGNLTGFPGLGAEDAFANHPTTASYKPAVQDHNQPGAHVAVHRLAKGRYRVTFVNSAAGNGGDVQVTAVATTDRHCYVVRWAGAPDIQALVTCVDNHGNRVDSPFTVQWVVAP